MRIEGCAFSGCTSLASAVMPKSVVSVGGEYITSSEITNGATVLPSDGVKTVRVFLWESLESMKPLCEAKETTVE